MSDTMPGVCYWGGAAGCWGDTAEYRTKHGFLIIFALGVLFMIIVALGLK